MYQLNPLDKLFDFIKSLFTFPFSHSDSFSIHYENNNLITQIERSLNPNNFKQDYKEGIIETLKNNPEVLRAIKKSLESKKTILGVLLYEKNSTDLFDTIYPNITDDEKQQIDETLARHRTISFFSQTNQRSLNPNNFKQDYKKGIIKTLKNNPEVLQAIKKSPASRNVPSDYPSTADNKRFASFSDDDTTPSSNRYN